MQGLHVRPHEFLQQLLLRLVVPPVVRQLISRQAVLHRREQHLRHHRRVACGTARPLRTAPRWSADFCAPCLFWRRRKGCAALAPSPAVRRHVHRPRRVRRPGAHATQRPFSCASPHTTRTYVCSHLAADRHRLCGPGPSTLSAVRTCCILRCPPIQRGNGGATNRRSASRASPVGATDGPHALHEQDGSGHGVHPGGYVFGLLFVQPMDALQSGRHASRMYTRTRCASAASRRNLNYYQKMTIQVVCAALLRCCAAGARGWISQWS